MHATKQRFTELYYEQMSLGRLPIYTVTQNPEDYPGKFVVRLHVVDRGKTMASDAFAVKDTLEAIRALMPDETTVMPREPNDLPVIVESWI